MGLLSSMTQVKTKRAKLFKLSNMLLGGALSNIILTSFLTMQIFFSQLNK